MNIDYEQLARRIREIATAAVSEMDLQVKVEKILDPYIPRVPGVESSHYGHSATNFRGIKDAFHGSLIVEYERPGKLSTAAGKSEAIEQLTRYLTQEARAHGPHAQDALRRMAGVGLDGDSILFVRWRGSKPGTPPPKFADLLPGAQSALFPDAMPTEYFHLLGPYPVNAETVRVLIDVYLRNLSRIPLDPERLAEAFGPKSPVAQSVVGAMYERLASCNTPRVLTFFGEWERIFGIVYGQDIEKSEVDAAALGDQFGIPGEPQLKRLLFVIHTYFALLMKLLAAEILSMQQGAMAPSFIEPLVTYESDNFRAALSDIEDGALFSRLGIRNFLEGDFFSWYLGVIDAPLLEALRDMVRTLAHFEPRTPSLDPTSSRDLLKRLYQYLVPRACY